MALEASCGKPEAIKNALEEFNGVLLIHFFGQTLDSGGGGGVLESLALCLKELGLTHPMEYVVLGCTIHALQLRFANRTKETFGEGRIDS
jgi:hypothetical protein